MARKRLVSPKFFQHAELYDLEQTTGLPLRLAFAGLWTQCDRRGLFPWKPRELKLAVLPYDAVDFDLVLWSLVMGGFLVCFDVDGKRYGHVPNFDKHQTFHRDEKPDRTLPDVSEGVVVAADSTLSTRFEQQQKCEHGASTVSAPCEHGASTPITITNTIAVTDTVTSGAARTRPAPKGTPTKGKAWPHFGADDRARVLAAFRKIGVFPAGRVINAVADCYRPATDPGHIAHAYVTLGVEDYCGLITKGKSAPFASPEDCAKKLVALARNCERYESTFDPVGRHDANFMAVHGQRAPGVAA